MKQKLLNIKYRLVALWWILTRKNYYLLSYKGRQSGYLESYNVVIPEFIEWIRKKPINRKVEGYIHAVGLIALLVFAVGIS